MKALIQYLSSLSLRAKFLAINVPLVLLATLSLFTIFEIHTHRSAIQGLRQSLGELVTTQSAALANPLWNLDDTQIQLTLAAIATSSDVIGARVFDETGKSFDEVGDIGVTIPEVGLNANVANDGEKNAARIIDVPQTNRIVARTDVVFADGDEQRVIGELVIAATNQRVWQATRNRIALAGVLALIVVASAVFSALFAYRRTIGIPLERLLTSITRSQSGTARELVEWQSKDEIGAVISAFNDMQQKQETDELELKTARDHLEQRVEERTEELATAHGLATTARDDAMRAQNQLSDAIESITEGFSLYGPDDCLVLCNSRYKDIMYPDLKSVLEMGTSFETMIRSAAEQGLVVDAEGRKEEWVQERLAQHSNPGGPHLQQRDGDRWVQINERKTEDGSTVAIYSDLTDLMRAEHALRESEERLRAFFDNSPFEIFLKDTQGRHVLVNRKFEEMNGFTEGEVIGKTTHEIFPQSFADISVKQDRTVIESGNVISTELEATIANDLRITVTDKFPVRSADGGIAGVGGIVTDITDRKERERQLAELVENLEIARDEAEAANQAKSAFLATMSHEIRTPMNSVVGMTSLLLDTEQTAEQREFTEIVRNSSDALLTIINDILDFSKIEAGRLELELQTFELRDCIQGALDLLASKATEKNLELAYVVSPNTPEAIIGDMSRLRQVLVNLLNNALKFTEQGEVILSVSIDPTSSATSSNSILQFSVTDSGVGIPAERMDRLFQPFSQVDASISRRHGGTGLGLAISKRLCELMGGRMWVESEEGKGSVFHFNINAEAVDKSEYDFLHAIQPQLRMKRLLVVENNDTSRNLIVDQTREWGMQPHATASANEALGWIRQGEHFDLAIVDRHMPDMEGIELTSTIRKQSNAKDLPIIMLTSLGEQEGELAGLNFDAFLGKPIKPSQLFDVLVNISVGKPVTHQVREQVTTSTFDESMGREFPLRILLTEDNANNQKLALLVLSRLGYRADVAGNGIEALEALQRQSYDVVLMDVQMPEMDGLEATRRIRKKRPNNQTPWIIAMTANAMQGDREMCLEAGMNDYVTKPIRIEQVTTSLKQSWSSLHGAILEDIGVSTSTLAPENSDQVDQQQTKSSKKNNHPILDPSAISRLEQLAGDDHRFLVEYIDIFLNGVPKILDDMKQGLDSGNNENLSRAAHTFKSNSAALGAVHLSELCKELEHLGKNGELVNAPDIIAQIQQELEPVKAALQLMRKSHGG